MPRVPNFGTAKVTDVTDNFWRYWIPFSSNPAVVVDATEWWASCVK